MSGDSRSQAEVASPFAVAEGYNDSTSRMDAISRTRKHLQEQKRLFAQRRVEATTETARQKIDEEEREYVRNSLNHIRRILVDASTEKYDFSLKKVVPPHSEEQPSAQLPFQNEEQLIQANTETYTENPQVVDEPELIVQEETETKKEKAARLANKASWLMIAGKGPVIVAESLVQDLEGADYSDRTYYRAPVGSENAGAFFQRTGTGDLSSLFQASLIGRSGFLGEPYVIGEIRQKPNKDETTLRYQPIQYEDGSQGLLIIVTLVNKPGRGDRNEEQADYFVFDLPLEDAKEFISDSFADPSFIYETLKAATGQKPGALSRYQIPQRLISAVSPGLNGIQRAKSQSKQFEGPLLIAEKGTVKDDQNQDVPLEGLLDKLSFKADRVLALDRVKTDEAHKRQYDLPEQAKRELESAVDLKQTFQVCERNSGIHYFEDLKKKLLRIYSTISFSILSRKNNNAMYELIAQLPGEFNVQEKCRTHFEGVQVALEQLINASEIQSMEAALVSLASHTDKVSFGLDLSPLSAQTTLGNFRKITSLKDDPVSFMDALMNPVMLPRELVSKDTFALDVKIYLEVSKKWGPLQKWSLRKLAKSERYGDFMKKVEKVKSSS